MLPSYVYAGGSPTVRSDPLGLIVPGDPDPTDEILIAAGLKKLYDLYKNAKRAKSALELKKHIDNFRKAINELKRLKDLLNACGVVPLAVEVR
jgi:hypothetical protein